MSKARIRGLYFNAGHNNNKFKLRHELKELKAELSRERAKNRKISAETADFAGMVKIKHKKEELLKRILFGIEIERLGQ